MDTYDLVSKHPLLAILRNVPLEKAIDYAEAAVQAVPRSLRWRTIAPTPWSRSRDAAHPFRGPLHRGLPAPPSPWSAAKPLWTPVHSSF